MSEKLLINCLEASKLLGIGRSHLYAMHSSGKLGPMPIRLGRRTLWDKRELENWVSKGCKPRRKWMDERGKNGF